MFQPKYIQFKQSQVPQWYIDASYMLGGTFHTILSAVNEELLSWEDEIKPSLIAFHEKYISE